MTCSTSDVFVASPAPLETKLDNFPKYVRRQSIARFLARYELFKLQFGVAGSIVECGVHHGGGVLTWAKLSAALEPYAIHRRIFGFDTFEGFPELTERDSSSEPNAARTAGEFHPGYDVYGELEQLIEEYDANRYLSELKKVFLIRGDAVDTIPAFVESNPYLLISLLFMDFDLYEPTRTALVHFVPRMCKGAILAFDELNNAWWPGETLALLDTIGVHTHRIERFPMDPNISYIIL
jgi:macrocin-O-methyltransferase TylF-like protien